LKRHRKIASITSEYRTAAEVQENKAFSKRKQDLKISSSLSFISEVSLSSCQKYDSQIEGPNSCYYITVGTNLWL
jgi:hypothetical protein